MVVRCGDENTVIKLKTYNELFYFHKRMLSLGSHTLHTAVTGELCIYPLAVIYSRRCVKYWSKILEMSVCCFLWYVKGIG